MKLGTENRTKNYVAGALALIAVYFAVTRLPDAFTTPPRPVTPTASGPNVPAVQLQRKKLAARGGKTVPVLTPTLDPRLRLDLLKEAESTEYKGSGRNIFRAEAEAPAEIPQPFKSPDLARQQQPTGPTPPPAPPPIPLKFFGIASKAGEPKRALLADGDDVFVAKEGDIVDRHYKVNKIGVNSVEIQDVLNNNVQTIPLTAQG
jgi:hypothetical protein